MYESPIKLYTMEPIIDWEDEIYKQILKYNIVVDKEELLRALRYDREQYNKGYKDALLERVSDWTISPFDGKLMCAHCYEPTNEKTFYCSYCGYKMTGKIVKYSREE